MKKKVLIIIVFLFIGVLLGGIYKQIFSFKNTRSLDKFYELPPNTADVIFIGSSHAYKHINPAVLYEEYGIAGYDLGGASQPLWNSYYYMEEALKTQKPKLVVVECYKITVQKEFTDSATVLKNTAGLRFSKTFIEAVNASVENPKERISFYLKFPWYHSRYAEIKACDFKDNYGDSYYDCFLGYVPEKKQVKAKLSYDLDKITEEKAITEKNMVYLDKICALAKEKNVQILFLVTPFSKGAEDKQPTYNALEKYASEQGVPFLNGNMYYHEIGLDGKKDFGNGNHLLYTGANKFTRFLGEYLEKNYELPDRRGDENYKLWQDNVKYIKNEDLPDNEIVE